MKTGEKTFGETNQALQDIPARRKSQKKREEKRSIRHQRRSTIRTIDQYRTTCRQRTVGASVSIISEISVPKYYHIEKYKRTIRDFSGQLNILGQISTEIEIGEIKIIEKFVVISKKHKIPGNVILGSDFLNKWNAQMDYSKKQFIGCYKLCIVVNKFLR